MPFYFLVCVHTIRATYSLLTRRPSLWIPSRVYLKRVVTISIKIAESAQTYVGSLVVEEVMVVRDEPSLPPVRADSTPAMLVEPTNLARTLKR